MTNLCFFKVCIRDGDWSFNFVCLHFSNFLGSYNSVTSPLSVSEASHDTTSLR